MYLNLTKIGEKRAFLVTFETKLVRRFKLLYSPLLQGSGIQETNSRQKSFHRTEWSGYQLSSWIVAFFAHNPASSDIQSGSASFNNSGKGHLVIEDIEKNNHTWSQET